MQFLAGLQIELIDYADDGLRRARTQAFDQRPQRVLPMRGIDDDRAARIETETVKAMSGDMTGEMTAETAALAQPVLAQPVLAQTVLVPDMDWRDEDDFFLPPILPPMWRRVGGRRNKASQHSRRKAEGSRECGLRRRNDLMQRGATETAIGQVGIKCAEAEGQTRRRIRRPAAFAHEPMTQCGQSRATAWRRGRGRGKCCWANHLTAFRAGK